MISLACLHRALEIIYCLLGSSRRLLLKSFGQYLLSAFSAHVSDLKVTNEVINLTMTT